MADAVGRGVVGKVHALYAGVYGDGEQLVGCWTQYSAVVSDADDDIVALLILLSEISVDELKFGRRHFGFVLLYIILGQSYDFALWAISSARIFFAILSSTPLTYLWL